MDQHPIQGEECYFSFHATEVRVMSQTHGSGYSLRLFILFLFYKNININDNIRRLSPSLPS